jgi:hypothetical protein
LASSDGLLQPKSDEKKPIAIIGRMRCIILKRDLMAATGASQTPSGRFGD